EDLFYVGYRTAPKLKARGISKIGDLAKKEPAYLRSFLGKMGEVLWYFANGYDASEVLAVSHEQQPKSVGNGITAVMDMKNREDMKMVFTVLVESVATRLKQQGLKGDVISIAIRNTDLKYYTRQRKIEKATNIASEIMKVVMELVDENVDFHYAYRSIDVHVSHLCIDDGVEQLSLFIDEKQREKEKKLDIVMDEIREKYGFDKIKRMSVMVNEELTDFDPLRDNIIHPVGYSNKKALFRVL
ncbi:MAG: DNA polymerase IV, partial [Sharpea porci]